MKIKRLLCVLLSVIILVGLCSCGKTENSESTPTVSGDTLSLSFKSSADYDFLKEHNGSKVTMNGYMATSSPADGSFMFLMNLPYQSCPFCVPNTSQLSNTIECYPEDGESFDFTNQAIKITGTLEVAEEQDGFTDMYGYSFSFKISDASYTIISADELGEKMALWQDLAQTDVITEVYNMFNYVNFLCSWNTYYVKSYTDENGNEQPGFYLYASDALNYIHEEDGQYHYGYVDGYFDGLVSTIEGVDKEAFSDLVSCIKKAETLAAKALKELEDGNYTSEYQYVDMFEQEDYIYTINIGDELASEMDSLYSEFSDWLGGWEM